MEPLDIIFDLLLRWHLFQPRRSWGSLAEKWRYSPVWNVTLGTVFADDSRTNFHSRFQLNSISSNLCSNWDAVQPGIIDGDLGPKSKYNTVELHFPTIIRRTAFHKNKLIVNTLFVTAVWNYSHLVAPPLHLLQCDFGDFRIGFKDHFLSETLLEFPLGQIWKGKENRKKSHRCQDTPGCVQRSFPCPFSLNLPGRPPLGRTRTVITSHVSKVQSREERNPASTPC